MPNKVFKLLLEWAKASKMKLLIFVGVHPPPRLLLLLHPLLFFRPTAAVAFRYVVSAAKVLPSAY